MNSAAGRENRPVVVMFAYFFDPEKSIGAVRPFRFYKYLREMGYDCRVFAATVPAGAPLEGVTVIPDRMEDFWQRRLAASLAGQTLEPISASAHIDRTVRRIFLPGQIGFSWSQEAARIAARMVGNRPVVVFSTWPPFGTVGAGYLLKRATGAKWIADFRDPARVPPGVAFPLVGKMSLAAIESAVLRLADAVVANTEMAGNDWRQNSRLAPKIHVIWNGFDPASELRALPVPQRGYRLILHAGSLYGGRNPNVILAAATRVLARRTPHLPPFRIVQVGTIAFSAGIDEALHDSAARQGWFEVLPRVPNSDAVRMMCEADGSLLLQPQSSVQVPAKVFEYISIGRPILAVAPRGSAVELILGRSGVPFRCVYPDDAPAVADTKLEEFLALPSTPVQPSERYLAEFDARIQTAHLAQVIEQLAGPR